MTLTDSPWHVGGGIGARLGCDLVNKMIPLGKPLFSLGWRLAGGGWFRGAQAGARAVWLGDCPWGVSSDIGARLGCDLIIKMIRWGSRYPLLAGGGWPDGARAGARAVQVGVSPWYVSGDIGARLGCDLIIKMIRWGSCYFLLAGGGWFYGAQVGARAVDPACYPWDVSGGFGARLGCDLIIKMIHWGSRYFLLAGGNWNNGAQAGARAVNLNNYPWNVNGNIGARLGCDLVKGTTKGLK